MSTERWSTLTPDLAAEFTEAFGLAVDALTEAVVAVRLLVSERDVLNEAERFERHAKPLEQMHRPMIRNYCA